MILTYRTSILSILRRPRRFYVDLDVFKPIPSFYVACWRQDLKEFEAREEEEIVDTLF